MGPHGGRTVLRAHGDVRLTPSENRPHVICRKADLEKEGRGQDWFPNFREAWLGWCKKHHWSDPWVIVTVSTGRVIYPEWMPVDVSE